jgi:hypothetical protein
VVRRLRWYAGESDCVDRAIVPPAGIGFNERGVSGTSGGVTASDLKWEVWLERLYNLRRDKRGSQERPHKPALLLRIIDLQDRSVITANEVRLSDELVTTFKRYFAVVP